MAFDAHFVPDSVPGHQLNRLAEPGFENYGLRLAPRLGDLVPSTPVDEDQSRDFDPQKPNVFDFGLSTKGKRESIYEEGYEPVRQSRPKRPKVNTYLYGRNVGESKIIKLTFKTNSGKAFFPLFDKLPSSQLGDSIKGDNSDHDSGFWSASPDASSPTGGQSAQRMPRKAVLPYSDSDDEKEEHLGTLKLEDLTNGHPAARGCKACFELGLMCDLLHEGSSYPCNLCLLGNEECELIFQPLRKAACLACKKSRKKCSYSHEGSDHSQDCIDCFLSGKKCLAGPLNGRMRTGPSLDYHFLPSGKPASAQSIAEVSKLFSNQDDSLIAMAAEAHEAKTLIYGQRLINAMLNPVPRAETAQQAKSGKASSRPSVCQQHIDKILNPVPRQKHNETIEPKASLQKKEKTQTTIRTVGGILAPLPSISKDHGYTITNPYSLLTPSPSPEGPNLVKNSRLSINTSVLPASSLATNAKTITTRLAHPIQLNYTPSVLLIPASRSAPTIPACHFHPITAYSVLGLTVAKPIVVDSPDGEGYVEISGGHIDQGFPASRMCTSCVQQRVRIMACEGHSLMPLSESETYHGPAGKYVTALLWAEDDDPEHPGESWKWCHICPKPAVYKCSKAEATVAEEGARGEGGCGLLLCNSCMEWMTMEFEGNLEKYIECMLEECDGGTNWGVRADVEMLLKRGEVGRRIGKLISANMGKGELADSGKGKEVDISIMNDANYGKAREGGSAVLVVDGEKETGPEVVTIDEEGNDGDVMVIVHDENEGGG